MADSAVPIRFAVATYAGEESGVGDDQLQLRRQREPDDQGRAPTEPNQCNGRGNHELRLRFAEPTYAKSLYRSCFSYDQLLVRRYSRYGLHYRSAEHSQYSSLPDRSAHSDVRRFWCVVL